VAPYPTSARALAFYRFRISQSRPMPCKPVQRLGTAACFSTSPANGDALYAVQGRTALGISVNAQTIARRGVRPHPLHTAAQWLAILKRLILTALAHHPHS
jgi:hypothetical protein